MSNNPKKAMLRDFQAGDARRVNDLAVAAFRQFENQYNSWPKMMALLGKAADLAGSGELIVAECHGIIVGAVAYMPPHAPKADYFDIAWPAIRMLVVDPDARGLGVGKALTTECIDRARRDRSSIIALHTSPIMTAALSMYLKLGFHRVRPAPPLHGVDYAVYVKTIS